MKITILYLLFTITASTVIAQIQKGAGYFEGSLSGGYNNGESPQPNSTNSYSTNSWNLLISYGHYLNDRLAIGIGGGLTLSDYKNESASANFSSSSRQSSVLYYVAPFIRTSNKIADKFYWFGELSLMAGSGVVHNTNESTFNEYSKIASTQSTFGAGLRAGLNYFLNRHFALTMSYGDLSYYNTTVKENESDDGEKMTSDELNFNFSLSSITIGLQYFINNLEKK